MGFGKPGCWNLFERTERWVVARRFVLAVHVDGYSKAFAQLVRHVTVNRCAFAGISLRVTLGGAKLLIEEF